MDYQSMSVPELMREKEELQGRYDAFQAQGLKLNMARGKPGLDQLDLSMKMLDELSSTANMLASTGDDCRNYGMPDGLPEMREIFADMMGVEAVSYTHLSP